MSTAVPSRNAGPLRFACGCYENSEAVRGQTLLPNWKILTQTYKYIAIKKNSSLCVIHFLGRNPKISQSIHDQFRETFSKLSERNKTIGTRRRVRTSASGESA